MRSCFKIGVFLFMLFQTTLVHTGMRDLIILLDWDNESVERDLDELVIAGDPAQSAGFGPISNVLVQAVWQKAAPIVVSAATWRNVMQRKKIFTDFITKDIQALTKEYKGTFKQFKTEAEIQKFQYLKWLCCQAQSSFGFPKIKSIIQ